MREIKFRQRIQTNSTLETKCHLKAYWHYWGYFIDEREFVGPIGIVEWDKRESQQYTGLQDKNGKEIYEGDILKSGVKPWVVKKITACFMMIQQRPTRLITRVERFIHEEVEIIGNIYENPELLENPRP